jgi:hypothetical protein
MLRPERTGIPHRAVHRLSGGNDGGRKLPRTILFHIKEFAADQYRPADKSIRPSQSML